MCIRDSIEGDYFSFEETTYEIVGRATGRRLTLGDAVRIRVRRADLQKRQLDFELLLPGAPAKIIGYDNQLYFSRLFHKLKGYSPREYRKLRNKF